MHVFEKRLWKSKNGAANDIARILHLKQLKHSGLRTESGLEGTKPAALITSERKSILHDRIPAVLLPHFIHDSYEMPFLGGAVTCFIFLRWVDSKRGRDSVLRGWGMFALPIQQANSNVMCSKLVLAKCQQPPWHQKQACP